MRGEAGFGDDHMRGVLGMTRGSSTRGRGRRRLPGRCALFQWATGWDVAGGSLETSGALVQGAVNADVSELPALEAGLVIVGVVVSEGCVVVTAGPPDFCVSDSDLFFLGQRG